MSHETETKPAQRAEQPKIGIPILDKLPRLAESTVKPVEQPKEPSLAGVKQALKDLISTS